MPQKWKGGKSEAQKRYREQNRELLRERHRDEYQKNKEHYKQRSSIYRKENKDTVNAANKRWRMEFWPALRKEFIEAYGGYCSCCGEKEPKFLDLDHINNNGNKHRKEIGNNQQVILLLKRKGWPKEDYQLLCCNCNQGKYRNGGICPHKTKDLS